MSLKSTVPVALAASSTIVCTLLLTSQHSQAQTAFAPVPVPTATSSAVMNAPTEKCC